MGFSSFFLGDSMTSSSASDLLRLVDADVARLGILVTFSSTSLTFSQSASL
jgi:hypothetical protein